MKALFHGCGVWMVLLASVAALGQDDPQVPVYIEDSPAAQEGVEQARALRQQGRLADAVEQFHRVVEAYGTKLIPIDDGLYMEASRWVRRELRGDEALLGMYRQMYEPIAERDRESALRPHPSAAALEQVLGRYFLTPAGLRAGLDLAALYLERADLTGAVSVLADLEDHPNLDDHAVRYHTLAATEALLRGDQIGFARHAERLREIGGPQATGNLESLARRLHPPTRLTVAAEQSNNLPETLSFLDQPLWRLTFDQPEMVELTRHGAAQPRQALPVDPVVDGSWLLINEGSKVSAVDRFSGRPVWSYRGESEGDGESDVMQRMRQMPRLARGIQLFGDRRGVLPSGDRLYAIVGPATIWAARVEGAPLAELLCLDRSSGSVEWRVKPGDLDPTLDSAYFQGTPIVAYDRIFAMIRRHQAAGFQDAFVVAVDASTGALLWRRHISSAVTASRYAITPAPQMTLQGGTLFVTDNLAAVAAIEARDGSLRWEHIFQNGEHVTARGLGAPRGGADADVGPPVLVEAGLIVPPSNITGDMMVLDPRTGRLVRTLGATISASTDYLLPAGSDVVAVGNRVTLLNGRTLSPRWSIDVKRGDPNVPRGLAAVTARYVVVPADRKVLILNREDGSIVHEAATRGGGNVTVLDGQLVIADSAGVSSFMPWDRAYDAMLAQVEREPADPSAGLAITHLALLQGRSDAALKGAEIAVAAVDTMLRRAAAATPARQAALADARQAQQRVFDQLLAFTESRAGADLSLREAMFDRLASLTATPRQEVGYHLSVARLYEDMQRWTDAVDHYQAVLLNETLASQLYRHQDVLRQAGLEAHRRLTQLVDAQGPAVYQRFNLIADHQLAQIRSAGSSPQELMALAGRFPLADAAPLALLEAGQALVKMQRVSEAVTQFRRAYVRSSDPALLADIAGRLAQAYQQTQRPHQAMQWLRRVSREYPGLEPIRDGQPTPIDRWLSELAVLPTSRGVGPSLTLPLADPYLIRGQLLLPTHQPDDERPGNRVLTREGQVLRMYAGTPLSGIWEAALPAVDAQVLATSDEQVLLWSPQAGELVSLDATTGERSWGGVRPAELLASLGDPQDRRNDRPVEQREFMQMIDVEAPIVLRGGEIVVDRPEPQQGYLIGVAGGVICVTDHFGGVVGLDRHNGRMLWQKTAAIEQVSHLKLTADALAIGGISGAGTDAMSGAVQILDPLTGESRLPVLEDKQPPQWVGFVSAPGSGDARSAGLGGLLIVATTDQVTAHRLDGGEVVWRMSVAGPPLTGNGWTSAELVVLATNGGGLLVVDPATGELRARIRLGTGAGDAARDPVLIDDQWQLLTTSHATALRSDGQVLWRDARTDAAGDHDRLLQQFVGERYVVLVAETDRQGWRGAINMQGNLVVLEGEVRAAEAAPAPDDATNDGYHLFLLNRLTGSLEAEYRLTGLPAATNPQIAHFIDDHLLMSAGPQTLVIPGAAAGP